MCHKLYTQWSSKNVGELDDQPVSKKSFWICEKGHEWEETIFNRKNKKIGCPYCSGRRACHENCLGTLFPQVSLEWHPKNTLSVNDVTAGTHKKYWWICKKGHEWEASVVKRTKSKRNCPYCSNQKVCSDNSLANFETLAREWHPTKNGELTPKDVVFGSCTKVWWLCNCGYSWQATPRKRSVDNTGCPLCKASRGEKFISMWLKYEKIRFEQQFSFSDCKNKLRLPFDFYLNDLNMCIEYQGEQHYKPIPHFGGMKKFEQLKLRDKIKEDYCNFNKIKLLKIPYWKFESIRNILKEFCYG